MLFTFIYHSFLVSSRMFLHLRNESEKFMGKQWDEVPTDECSISAIKSMISIFPAQKK